MPTAVSLFGGMTSLEEALPRLDGVWQGRADGVPVPLGGASVDVSGEVGHLDQVVELIRHERDEGMPKLVRRPVRAQPSPFTKLAEGPAQVG
ncbi:MAG TPA: hypothetical protein VM328_11680, partial [Fimbriimonadaceae bacterium]|nr:hypothetical protein [Fimbriimonadaceae bacterium]